MQKHSVKIVVIVCLVAFMVLACKAVGLATPLEQKTPKVILQRLGVAFMGQDGHKIIGSGCPDTDGKGTIDDYHLIVSGVSEHLRVNRILVVGDNSTLTWEWPCSDNWGLEAFPLGNGNWEIFIAPSLPSRIYTVLFFYENDTFAIGMASLP